MARLKRGKAVRDGLAWQMVWPHSVVIEVVSRRVIDLVLGWNLNEDIVATCHSSYL